MTSLRAFALAFALLPSLAPMGFAQSATFEAGNWAAIVKGKTCSVYSIRSARDTTGYLEFSFDQMGYNANFAYVYVPFDANDVEAPWDMDADAIALWLGDEQLWLGEEMSFYTQGFTYAAGLTNGFVPELISAMRSPSGDFGFGIEKASAGETWLYGGFSLDGFDAALAWAGETCQFDPSALPQS
ncbi:hypothetical protein [Arenibacterium sp. LLYu02]|uniref:hypothetical protein n=1 Tax=Arenibacterium sp. LLYu02 TaxID=3404132 RepID=UPI003B21847B